jgi:hypothetical protein
VTFTDTEEVELQFPPNNNGSTAVAESSQNVEGADSTQTNRGAPHQSPPRVSSPSHDIQEHAELEELQGKDWEDVLSEDEAAEEAELARVQQEIERLR